MNIPGLEAGGAVSGRVVSTQARSGVYTRAGQEWCSEPSSVGAGAWSQEPSGPAKWEQAPASPGRAGQHMRAPRQWPDATGGNLAALKASDPLIR